MEYRTILADVPWRYRVTPPEGKLPYPTLNLDQIAAMGPQIQESAAANAHLYLWATKDHLHDAFHITKAWGFTYNNVIVWDKMRMGMGFKHFRNQAEFILFGVRGRLPIQRRDLTNIICERSTRHSRKPEAAYERIEAASPGPRLELFARHRRHGWHVWGNEVECDVNIIVPRIRRAS